MAQAAAASLQQHSELLRVPVPGQKSSKSAQTMEDLEKLTSSMLLTVDSANRAWCGCLWCCTCG